MSQIKTLTSAKENAVRSRSGEIDNQLLEDFMMTGTNRVATEIGNAIRSIVELGEQAQHHANRAQHLVAAIANADQQADGRPPDWMITFAALAKDEIENAVAMAQAIELKAYTVLVEHLDSEPPNSDGNEDI